MAKKPMSKKAKKMLANAIAAKTVAEAGVNGVSVSGGKGKPRGATPPAQADAAGTPNPIPAGSVAYSGKVYDKSSFGALAKQLNKRGVTVSQYMANNPGAQKALGISDKKLAQVVTARRLLHKAKKARQR